MHCGTLLLVNKPYGDVILLTSILFHVLLQIKIANQEVAKVRRRRAHIPEEKIKVTDPNWQQTWYLVRKADSTANLL